MDPNDDAGPIPADFEKGEDWDSVLRVLMETAKSHLLQPLPDDPPQGDFHDVIHALAEKWAKAHLKGPPPSGALTPAQEQAIACLTNFAMQDFFQGQPHLQTPTWHGIFSVFVLMGWLAGRDNANGSFKIPEVPLVPN